jgi:hypothetical protein
MTPAEDLELYLINDGEIHKQHNAVRSRLLKLMSSKRYDHNLAVQAFQKVADAAAKKYTKDLCTARTHGSFGTFDKPTRTAVAVSLRDRFEAAAKNGELSHLKEKL